MTSKCIAIGQGKKAHKLKQICGIVLGLDGCQEFVYVFFRGHSFYEGGEKKRISKIPPKIPGQSRDMFVFLCFFFVVSLFALPIGFF